MREVPREDVAGEGSPAVVVGVVVVGSRHRIIASSRCAVLPITRAAGRVMRRRVVMHDGEDGEFTIAASDAGARLDVILTRRLGCSRTRAQQAIEAGDVLVNGRAARASHKLRIGDRIEAELAEVAPVAALIPEALPLSVLHEDDELIVVDKPAGMVVHPAGDITRGTLANALAHRWRSDPLFVHRIDRDTSGLMVVARTAAAHEHLTGQFRRREIGKHYTALVHGTMPATHGAITEPIGRDRKHRLRMVCCAAGEGRDAHTIYTLFEQWPEFALLGVEIRTGRTHQIRVHCAHIGRPVVADEMYGKGRTMQVRSAPHRAAIAALGRQFLHASRLAFAHPRTGAPLAFMSPLHADLVALVRAIAGPPTAA